MEKTVFEGILHERISLHVWIHPTTQLIRLEVDGERETRIYEWGSLTARVNEKDLKKTLLDISARANATEATLTGKSIADIQQDTEYVRLLAFLNTLEVN